MPKGLFSNSNCCKTVAYMYQHENLKTLHICKAQAFVTSKSYNHVQVYNVHCITGFSFIV